jgi:hypothetical protein
MNYKIVRSSDQVVVEQNLTKEEAEKRIIFYDSPETPHYIQAPNEES